VGSLRRLPFFLLLFAIFLRAHALAFRRNGWPWKFLKERFGRHAQCGKTREPRLQPRVVNRFGTKLAVNPFRQAHLFDALQVTRPRPIT